MSAHHTWSGAVTASPPGRQGYLRWLSSGRLVRRFGATASIPITRINLLTFLRPTSKPASRTITSSLRCPYDGQRVWISSMARMIASSCFPTFGRGASRLRLTPRSAA